MKPCRNVHARLASAAATALIYPYPKTIAEREHSPPRIPTSALAVDDAAAEVVRARLVRQHNAIGAHSSLADAVLSGPRNFGFGSNRDLSYY
jgi:hypothetical protein